MTNINKDIYFDNATTSWPKTPEVVKAVEDGLGLRGSLGRGLDREVSHHVLTARRAVAQLFGATEQDRIIFQPSATQALNVVISDVVKPGAHLFVTKSEHNAVTRPLFYHAKQRGATVSWIPVDLKGCVDLDFIEKVVSSGKADAIFCQHGSNVTGAIHPIEKISQLIKAQNEILGKENRRIRFVVDAAQTGGHIPFSLTESGVDAWICSGHKGLGGPKGIGLLLLGSQYNPVPLIFGGTGSGDYYYDQEQYELPYSLEAGTESLPLIMGLKAAAIATKQDLSVRMEKETGLTCQLLEGLRQIEGLSIYGPDASQARLPIVSFALKGKRADEVGFELSQRFGISSRPGLHCAPALHEALGTKESGGLVRFGLSAQNDVVEVSTVIQAVKLIASRP